MAQINKPNLHVNTKLYTGNGADNTAQTGVGFKPDWLWIKSRSSGSYDHMVFDSTRGVTKVIRPNQTNAEGTDSSNLASFDSDGFTLKTGGYVNGNGSTFAAWNWKANGGTTSSNSDGSITTTVQANTTAGFSIISYTGTGSAATIGHGLGAVPKFIIIKRLSATASWPCYHTSLGNATGILLNSNQASYNSGNWNSTTHTSSVINLGGGGVDANVSSGTYIAYCFAEINGYSNFGSYTGNESADGIFVYTGFKPALILIKKTSASTAQNWRIIDNKRLGYNPKNHPLYPSAQAAEGTGETTVDFVSTGFKLRGTGGAINSNGVNYIYMAFAETPMVGTNNVPTTAR